MNTVKKFYCENLPQDFSPRTLPEILKLAKKINGDTALVYERANKPFFMETDRLIIRRFTIEDAEAVCELANDRMNSSMRNYDIQWPTDYEGCKNAVAYFAGEDIYFAVCLKPSMKLIGFIAYNNVNDEGILDLGHVWHTTYQDNSLDTEALSLMTQYAFEKLGVNGVTAGNPLECAEQIAPLKALGMEITEIRESASFVNDEHGNPIEFTGCKMLITKEKWEATNTESYYPKHKPEILNMMETVKKNELRYPPQYRIKPKGKTAAYTGVGWPHSNAYPAIFSAVFLFYGKESRLNEKGEQINDDLQYRIQGALSTEAYGVDYSELFEGDHLQNCLGLYGIKLQVVDCSDWAQAQVRDYVCTAVSSEKTVIIEPKEYKDMHFVFGYAEEGKTLFCCPFLDGDDKKNCSFNFQKYYKRKNRTAHVKRLLILEDTGEIRQPRDMYRQSLKQALKMMTTPSPCMDFTKLKGAGIGIYDAWIALLQQANAENSDVFYMHFPVFPQFIILYENRLHFYEFLRVCAETYGEFPELTDLIHNCEAVRDLAFEDAELGFHRENGKKSKLTMTNNERRNLLIDVLTKCRAIDQRIIVLLQKVCEVLACE